MRIVQRARAVGHETTRGQYRDGLFFYRDIAGEAPPSPAVSGERRGQEEGASVSIKGVQATAYSGG